MLGDNYPKCCGVSFWHKFINKKNMNTSWLSQPYINFNFPKKITYSKDWRIYLLGWKWWFHKHQNIFEIISIFCSIFCDMEMLISELAIIWSKKIIFIGIYFMPSWAATIRHGITRKRSTKRLKHTGNLFRKNLQ